MSNSNRGMEDFNPFASPVDTPTTQVRGASNPPMYGGAGTTPQPATLQPSNQEVPPPNYSRSAQQTAPQTFRNTFSPTGDVRLFPHFPNLSKFASTFQCYHLHF